jgi:hypothetical protein
MNELQEKPKSKGFNFLYESKKLEEEMLDNIENLSPDWVSVKDRLPVTNSVVLCRVERDSSKKIFYYVLRKVKEDDCDWRTVDDNSEITYFVTITHWKEFSKMEDK